MCVSTGTIKHKTHLTVQYTADRWPRNTSRQSRVGCTTQTKLGWADAERVRNNTKPEFSNTRPKINLTYRHVTMIAQTRRRIPGRLECRAVKPKFREAWKNFKVRVLTADSTAQNETSQYTHQTPLTTYDSESPNDILEKRVTEEGRFRISELRIATAVGRVRLTMLLVAYQHIPVFSVTCLVCPPVLPPAIYYFPIVCV